MQPRSRPQLVLFMTLLGLARLVWLEFPAAWAGPPSADKVGSREPAANQSLEISFARDIQPILQAKCYACHGPEVQESGLRLDQSERALEGGDLGALLVPGKSSQSRLMAVVRGIDEDLGVMPPEGEGTRLTEQEISRLEAWIDGGAAWPEGEAASDPRLDHWSFRPLVTPPVPELPRTELPAGRVDQNDSSRGETGKLSPSGGIEPLGTDWVRNPIDTFVLRRLSEQGISPSPPATRATLIRRVYLDVLGLPPNPEEVRAFVNDPEPGAYERLVERVLASPHYGERLGRYWLDLARYADSDGYEKDQGRPHAWRYRQWVIEALNDDMPFDQFSRWQIAGDLISEAGVEGQVAAGFHRNTLHNTEGGADPEEDRVKKTVDRTNTVAAIWLGLTFGCAQCHTHKYDPITQREYYGLYAFFNYLEEEDVPAPLRIPNSGEPPVKAQTVVQQDATVRTTHLLVRGDFLNPGPEVPPGTPRFLPRLEADAELPSRIDLADWLMNDENPLTPRTTVNRVWQNLFGRGLAPTSDDLGTQGEPPTHPELLDWLAGEFRQGGWSLKHLHRLILHSATYRQSSAPRAELADRDPHNTWLARQSRRRVEAEVIRDIALACSGLLDPRVGGPSVRPPQPAEYSTITYAGSAKWPVSQGGDRYRRGCYTFFQRTSPYPMLMTFDAPDATECTVRRSLSNTPLQALTLWNDPVFVESAQGLARRVWKEVPDSGHPERDQLARLRRAFEICLARPPEPEERDELLRVYVRQRELSEQRRDQVAAILGELPLPPGADPVELSAWVAVSRVLLNLDELIVRE